MTVSINWGELPLSIHVRKDFPDQDSRQHALTAIGYLTAGATASELVSRSDEEFDVVLAPDVLPQMAEQLLGAAGVEII